VLRVARKAGVVGAEEDGHQAYLPLRWEEAWQDVQAHGRGVAAKAAVDDIGFADVGPAEGGKEGWFATLGDRVAKEEDDGVGLVGGAGGRGRGRCGQVWDLRYSGVRRWGG